MSLNYQEILRNADKLRIFLPFFLKNTRLHCFNLYNFGWWKLKNTNKLVPYSQGPGQCQEQAQFFQFRVHLPKGGHVLPFSSAWSYQQLNLRLLELALAPQTQTPHPVPCHHPGPENKSAIINCQLPSEAGITKKRKEKKRGLKFFFFSPLHLESESFNMRVRSNSLLLGGGLHLLDFHCGRHTLLQNPKSPTESCSRRTKKKKRENKAADRNISATSSTKFSQTRQADKPKPPLKLACSWKQGFQGWNGGTQT